KKVATFPGGGTEEAFRFIWKQQRRHPVKRLCEHLRVSRAWRNRKPSARQLADSELLRRIQRIYRDSQHRYGSPKIHRALRDEGVRVGEKRVARLMREAGLKARVEWVYRRLKNRRALLKALPNHRLELPKPNRPNQQWSSDVTYLRLGRRWVYLVVILDLWSRRILSWKLSDRLTAEL